MAVYTIFDDTGEEYESGFGLLDGDMKKVLPVGFQFHPVTNGARLPDGTRVKKNEFYQGVRVDLAHLPTKVLVKGKKRELTDLQRTNNIFMVSDNLRRVVDQLEPDVHQFKPVELVWEDGSHAGSFFWFYPGNSIDSIDREKTTHAFDESAGLWVSKPGGQYVVNLAKLSGNNIWIDPRTHFGSVFVSESFKQAMADAGVKGIGYNNFPTV